MQTRSGETVLLCMTRIGVWLALFTPIIVFGNLFFPYITGKNFFFRIIIELTAGCWLGLLAMNRAYLPRRSPVLFAFGAFFIAVVLATLFGADPHHSFWSNYERMEGLITYIHVFLLFLIAGSVFVNDREWRTVFLVSVGVSILVSFYGLFEKTGIVAPGGSVAGTAGAGRIFSTLGNPIYLAVYILIHFFLLGYLASKTKELWARVGYGLIGIFELYIFVATGTRGAVLGLIAGILIMLMLVALLGRNTKIRWGAFALVGVALVGVFALYNLREASFVRSSPLLQRLTDFDVTSSTASSRFTVWKMGWESFKERPILGWGPENFIVPFSKNYIPDFYGNEPWFDRTHNMYLEWLVDTGIVGFGTYLILFGAVFYTLFKLWQKQQISVLQLGILCGLIIAYLVQNTFVFDNITTYMLLAVLFGYVHSMYVYRMQGIERIPPRSLVQNNTFGAMFAVVIAIVVMYVVNFRPMSVAAGIITMLQATGADSPVQNVVNSAKDLDRRGTFGITEAHERLADLCLQIASSPPKNLSTNDFSLLMTKCIDGMEQEVRNHPNIVKNVIMLAKLYEVRFAFLQSPVDKAASLETYQKAIELAPNYPSVYIGMAETYLVAKDSKGALESVNKILPKFTAPNIYFYTALTVNVLASDFDSATQIVQRYVELQQRTQFAGSGLDVGLMPEIITQSLSSKDSIGRERFLLAAQKNLPVEDTHSPVLLLALAQTYQELGKLDTARMYAEQVASKYPDYKDQVNDFLAKFK
jgi:oligosaccharide repeat unit polymerase